MLRTLAFHCAQYDYQIEALGVEEEKEVGGEWIRPGLDLYPTSD